MKNYKVFVGTISLLLGFLLLGGCSDILNSPLTNNAGESVTISINSTGRTILPGAPVFEKYELTFTANEGQTQPQENPVELENSSQYTLTLETGSWTISVIGMVLIENIPGIEDGYYEAASGSADFNVGAGASNSVAVTVRGGIQEGVQGTFSWDISFPDEVIAGTLEILDIDEQPLEDIDPVDLMEEENRAGSIALNPGYYFLKVELENEDGNKAYRAEIFHIYSNLTTTAGSGNGYAFTTASFAPMVTLNGQVILNMNLNPQGVVCLFADARYTQLIASVPFDESGTWNYRISPLMYSNVYLMAAVTYTGYEEPVERIKGPMLVTSTNAADWTINCLLPNTGISIGDPSVKLYLNDGTTPLENNGSTIVDTAGDGIFTVGIASGSYSEIKWFVNGNLAAQGSGRTSIVLPKRTAGTYLVTVEATTGGVKNTGTHSFVVE